MLLTIYWFDLIWFDLSVYYDLSSVQIHIVITFQIPHLLKGTKVIKLSGLLETPIYLLNYFFKEPFWFSQQLIRLYWHRTIIVINIQKANKSEV